MDKMKKTLMVIAMVAMVACYSLINQFLNSC